MGIKDSELDIKVRMTLIAVLIFGGLAVLCLCVYLLGYQAGWLTGTSMNIQDFMAKHGLLRLPP
jgi:hypothetical protein